MPRIVQAHVSPAVRFFEAALRRRYALSPYSSPHRPAIFFGCYSNDDLRLLLGHRSTRVMVWRGSDAMDRGRLATLRRAGGIHHVAVSRFIAGDLERAGIPCLELPVTAAGDGLRIDAVPKGDGIYVYTSAQRPDFYGRPLVEALRARFPDIRFHVCAHDSHPRDELFAIYRRCFLGLRLVPHDGLSNTVVELGLHGIKSVYNGGLPGSLAYRDLDDIAAHIVAERATVGSTDEALARRMREFLTLPPDWSTVEFFEARLGPRRRSPLRSWLALGQHLAGAYAKGGGARLRRALRLGP